MKKFLFTVLSALILCFNSISAVVEKEQYTFHSNVIINTLSVTNIEYVENTYAQNLTATNSTLIYASIDNSLIRTTQVSLANISTAGVANLIATNITAGSMTFTGSLVSINNTGITFSAAAGISLGGRYRTAWPSNNVYIAQINGSPGTTSSGWLTGSISTVSASFNTNMWVSNKFLVVSQPGLYSYRIWSVMDDSDIDMYISTYSGTNLLATTTNNDLVYCRGTSGSFAGGSVGYEFLFSVTNSNNPKMFYNYANVSGTFYRWRIIVEKLDTADYYEE